MVSRALLTISVSTLLWAGGPAMSTVAVAAAEQTAQMRFAAMDTNGDGIITRQEWRGTARAFENLDWNGDGRLSGDEVRAGARRNTTELADHNPNRAERNLSWTQAHFNTLDHNRDNRLTSNEWHYDLETFRRVDRNRDDALSAAEFLGQGDEFDDARDASFDDLDFNNNGRVEKTEWYGSAAAFNALDRNRDGVLSRFEVVGSSPSLDTFDQFNNLDYDRNGNIARNEWHWSAPSFNQRDTNRDGVLSRREFEVSGGTPAAASGAGSQSVRVNAQQRWTDTGLQVRTGDTVTFDASGQITMSDNASDTATPAGSTTGRNAPDAPVLNQLAGGLIAQIGGFNPIFVGNRRTITAPVSGRLYLGVNDDHLGDNRGEFVVNVGVRGRTSR